MLNHSFFSHLFNFSQEEAAYLDNFYRILGDQFDPAPLSANRLKNVDLDLLLYEIFRQINNAVFTKIIENLEEGVYTLPVPAQFTLPMLLPLCQERIDVFMPGISSLSSEFGNEIDEIKNEKLFTSNISDIADCVIPSLFAHIQPLIGHKA